MVPGCCGATAVVGRLGEGVTGIVTGAVGYGCSIDVVVVVDMDGSGEEVDVESVSGGLVVGRGMVMVEVL